MLHTSHDQPTFRPRLQHANKAGDSMNPSPIPPSQPSLPSGQSSSSNPQRPSSFPWSTAQMTDPPISLQSRSSASSVVISPCDGSNSVQSKASSDSSAESGPLLKEHDYIGLGEVSSASVQPIVTEGTVSCNSRSGAVNMNLEETDLRLGLGLPEDLNSAAVVGDNDSPRVVGAVIHGFSSGVQSLPGFLVSHTIDQKHGAASERISYTNRDLLCRDRSFTHTGDGAARKELARPEASKLGKQSFGLGNTVSRELSNCEWVKSDGQRERQVDSRALWELHSHSKQGAWMGRDLRFTSADNTSDRGPATVSDLSPSQNLWQAQIFRNIENARVYPSMQLPLSGQDLAAVRSSVLSGFSGTRVPLPATKNGVKRGYSEAMADTRFIPANSRNGLYEGLNSVPPAPTAGGKSLLQLPQMEATQHTKHPTPSFMYNWASAKPPGVGSWQVGLEQSGGSFGPFTSLPNKPTAVNSGHSKAVGNGAGASLETLSKNQETPPSMECAGVQSQRVTVDNQQTSTNDALLQKGQVVGWPPIRSFRKTTLASHPKPVDDEEELIDGPVAAASAAPGNAQNSLYVKVNMDGVPIGRKVDVNAYNTYEGLSHALEDMFQRSNGGHGGSLITPSKERSSNDSKQLWFLTGSDYVLTYEDKEGDWMLVGDVPWGMFVSTVRRLRIMKGSEATGLGM